MYHNNIPGVWIVTYHGVAGIAVDSAHNTEVEAHREANGTGYTVRYWPYGTPIGDSIIVGNDGGD